MDMKQTVKEAANEMCKAWGMEDNHGYSVKDTYKLGFAQGAEWQAKQNTWISVKDKLPEVDEKVIILYEYSGHIFADNHYYHGECENWCFGSNNAIIAWMPFPSVEPK